MPRFTRCTQACLMFVLGVYFLGCTPQPAESVKSEPSLNILPDPEVQIRPDLSRTSDELNKIFNYIDAHISEHVADLQRWIRQPSISNTGEGILESARMVEGFLKEKIGCQRTEIYDPGITEWGKPGHPVVYGEYDAGADKTVLIYVMYDTMPVPPYEVEKWVAPPFEGRIIEKPPFKKVLIGRGATNSKGPEMSVFNAIASIRAVTGKLPVNLIVVAEGDEERMDIGLRKFVFERKAQLARANALIGFGTQRLDGVGVPSFGSEGCLYVELETSGARWGRGPTEYNVHGMNKRILDSPAWRHIQMLSTLTADNGNRILVDGWYDKLEKPTRQDLAMIDAAMKYFKPEALLEGLRAKHFINEMTGKELFIRALYEPTFNVDGIFGGLTEPGTAGSVMPFKITSKHNMRYGPNMDGKDMLQKLRAYLDKKGYSDVEIRVIGDVPWSRVNNTSDLAQAIFKTYQQFGVEYFTLPATGITAGAGPYWPAYLFARDPLQMPVVLAGVGHGGGAHSVNEYFVIEGAGKVYGMAGAEKGYAAMIYNYAGKN